MNENLKFANNALNENNLSEAVERLTAELEHQEDLGPWSVYFANKLMASFPWSLVSRLLPPGTNFFETSGWVESIRLDMPVDAEKRPLPWMNYACIDFLGSFIAQRRVRVFEWGSGCSTIFFAEHAQLVRAVEDNKSWFDEITRITQGIGNIDLLYRSSKDEYVRAIEGLFDVIIVDGSHRPDCLEIACRHLNNYGLIVLDNSDDSNLDESILRMDSDGFYSISFSGLIPSYAYKNVSTVFFKDPEILRIPRHSPPSTVKYSSGETCSQAANRPISMQSSVVQHAD